MQETSERSRAAQSDQELETRKVTVNEPGLSQTTNERLTEEVRDVLGTSEVHVPKGRSHPSKGESVEDSGFSRPSSGWLMTVIGVFAALVITGIIVSSVTGSWWFVAAAFAVDVVGVAIVAVVVVRMTAVTDRPEPTLGAAMQAEGVSSPDQHFSRIVEEFREPSDESDSDDEHRKTTAQDDPNAASEEQRSAVTPSSGPSKAVGP